jgi:pimeloyl-ACP methyl ester carboxylesterase
MDFNSWSDKGRYENINGRNIFVIDNGSSKNTIVILHGFPSCSYDYWKVLPILSEKFRVIIHDHIGFGFSDKPKEYSYSLFEQADTALETWQKLGLKNAALVAHDYGCSVATEIIARANTKSIPLNIQSVTLGNGSILIDMAKLQMVQKLLRNKMIGPLVSRFSSKWFFRHSMEKLWSDKSKIESDDFNNLWKMIQYNNGMNRTSQISQYLKERVLFKDRWVGALQQTEIPIHFVWGEDDPIAILAMAKMLHQLAPKSTLNTLPNVGHYPMLEAPKRWSSAVLKNISS